MAWPLSIGFLWPFVDIVMCNWGPGATNVIPCVIIIFVTQWQGNGTIKYYMVTKDCIAMYKIIFVNV